MPLIKAFPGLRPANGRAEDVAAPPYDVMNEAEAREMVEGRPWSFLHISRAEVDLPVGTDPYSPEVYAKAAENLAKMEQEGVLVRDAKPCFYVYRLTMGEHVQTGLAAVASVQAYDNDRIKKHEFTRPAKEDDRVRQVDALNAQTGPVFLVYPSAVAVDDTLALIAEGAADMDVTAADGVRHQIWVADDEKVVEQLTREFDAMPALYVADGHHRSAAGSRVGAARKAANSKHTGEESYNYFLSVIFPHNQMKILDYNRVVKDLNGLDKEAFLEKVEAAFTLEMSDTPVKPAGTAEFGMYLDGQWYRLSLDPARIPADDPVARLDVSLLADNLIEPILGISDPRRDSRIDFVGGIRGLEGLEARVDSGEMQVAFSLFPTSMEALMAVADAGEVMPPKSTWFEPKLADGLVSHVLD
ncbi:DUF1015 domain-containing protein [endosymbiont of Ridgeia piscesae]|jgi:uncharacterized protein (DUF1015 family)|uniref:Uncharacterized conserved protein, DUF1015 family n=2 Tax=Gammaproteobacteria TaxID=1236 RepID=A0A0T5YVI1_9GAMM|nr:DUF1015 family protein [endosymbiont of Ridgeia piscesae]KRT54651.1 hypothetical protein Ga0074115_10862 [endosymbiont of Ridgeia piscesae]KRT58482.1 Uncharacterized conserved protein, DUF1015 family [endosymbiont of Ridgeia piscesae]